MADEASETLPLGEADFDTQSAEKEKNVQTEKRHALVRFKRIAYPTYGTVVCVTQQLDLGVSTSLKR